VRGEIYAHPILKKRGIPMNHAKSKSVAVNLDKNLSLEIKPIPLARWISNPNSWDKYQFIEEASTFIWEAYGHSTDQDKHALAMLAEMLETFVICCKDIAKNGLVVTHHNGVTGKNHHVDIRDKAVTKAVLLMNELGLTPKGRFPFKTKPDPEFEKFMRGPNWDSHPKEPINLEEILKNTKRG
jgi:hypothetical protein